MLPSLPPPNLPTLPQTLPSAATPPVTQPTKPTPEVTPQPLFSGTGHRLAQAIIPANNGTETIVTPDGNRIDITGGQLSRDGANLFHQFEQFGLSAEQVANFLALPEVQNILGTVSGGNASVINGLLQVSGSDANLFLINPAGILFGPDAALNLSGGFTAATADRVGFGDAWLTVAGDNPYGALVGHPTDFVFSSNVVGALVNSGNLSVGVGETLTLLGGTVINTGTLTAPGGQVTVAAVPGQNRVRISQTGQLLSLELPTLPEAQAEPAEGGSPLDLPALLTGSGLGSATGLVVEADGTVRLVGSTVEVQPGSTVVSGNVGAGGGVAGTIDVLGDQVHILGATLEASGRSGGGRVRVGGDFQGSGTTPRARSTQVDATATILADATQAGDGGRIVIWGDERTTVDGFLAARGGVASGNGGLIETSGGVLTVTQTPDASATNGFGGTWRIDPSDIALVAGGGGPLGSTTIDVANINSALNSGTNVTIATNPGGTGAGNITQQVGATIEKILGPPTTLSLEAANDIVLNDSIGVSPTAGTVAGSLNLTLTADADNSGAGAILSPSTTLTTNGGSVTATGVGIDLGSVTSSSPVAGGNVLLRSLGDIRFATLDTRSSLATAGATAGNVVVEAQGTVRGTGTQAGITVDATSPGGNGTVTIQHDGGPTNAPFEVGNATQNGTAGAIAADQPLTSGTFEVLPTTGSVNPTPAITITSINTPPDLSLAPQLVGIQANQTLSFTLADLNPAIADANRDLTGLVVAEIPTGTLLRNGVPLQIGDVIAPTDPLQYRPADGARGAFTAFSLRASDGVSQSAPIPVGVSITPDPDPDPPTRQPDTGLPHDPDPPIRVTEPNLLPNPSPLPLSEPINTEYTVLVGTALAQSPQLEDLVILGSVLPEPSLLIVEAIFTGGRDNGGGVKPGSGDLQVTLDPSLGEPGGTGTIPDSGLNLKNPGEDPVTPGTAEPPSSPDTPAVPPPVDVPSSPGIPDLPPDPPAEPGPLPPPGSEPAEPESPAPPTDAPAPQADAPSQSVSSPINQTLRTCQTQAQQVRSTAAAERTEGVYAALIGCYEQSLTAAVERQDFAGIAYSLNNLATSFFVLGDYTTALDLYQQQLDTALASDDPTQQGIALGGIGAVYAALGDYRTAIDYYTQGLNVMPIETAPQWKALIYRNLGNAYFAQKEYPQAAEYQRTSLEISQAVNDTYGEMQALGNLGHTFAIQGDFAEAIAAYEQGLTLATTLKDNLEKAQMLLGLSTAYAYQQRYDQAYEYSKQSLTLTRALGAKLGEGIALTNLGNALLYLDRLPEAEQQLGTAIATWESLRAGLGTNDAFKVSIFETQLAAYRNLQEVLVNQDKIEAALEISERGRARAFVELLARGAANSDPASALTPPTLADIQQTARSQNATLVEYSIIRDQVVETPHGASAQTTIEPKDARLYIWVVSPSGRVQFRQVSLEETFNQTSVADLVSDTRLALTSRPTTLASRGDSSLQPGDLVKRRGDLPDLRPYEILSVAADGRSVTVRHPDFVLPDPVLPVDQIYQVEGTATAAADPLQQLHTLLIAPIADLLPSDPTAPVVFIPQEHLFLVPFAAIQTPQGQYLIEQHTPLMAPSIQVLALAEQADARPAAAPTEALIVGNPSPMPSAYAPLPYAEAEAAAIANLLAVTPLVGADATEAQVKARLSTASLIHLATHGRFDETQPLQGAIALAPQTPSDGFLTAAEILELPLQAELVVLSACDTGRGKITGDGVIGLSRAFMAAGVPRVVVSLWQVPDASTTDLMVAFHQARQQSADPVQALRQAMLKTLETHPDPAAWAPFTLIGTAHLNQ